MLLTAVVAVNLLGQDGDVAARIQWLGPPDDEVIERYEASEGQLGELLHRRPGTAASGDAAALWDEWSQLVPAYYSRRVEVFELASDGAGPGTFAAYVSPLDDGGTRWRLAIDPVDHAQDPTHYERTLVHELGHVLTLSDSFELRPTTTLAGALAACPGPATTVGCIDPDSLLGRWIEEFWTAEDVTAADRMRGSADGPAPPGVITARYREVRDRYVSPYATTDPEEDIAESIAALAFRDPVRPRSEAAEKLAMLEQDPQIFAFVVAVREQLRA